MGRCRRFLCRRNQVKLFRIHVMGEPDCLGRSWEVLVSWAQKLDPLLGLLGRPWRSLGNLGLYPAKLAKQIWGLGHDSGILVRDPLSVPTCNSR